MKRVLLFVLTSIIFSHCKNYDENLTSLHPKKQSFHFSGSDTEIPLVKTLITSYQKKNISFNAEITGGGSLTGINKFIEGTVDVVNTSRRMEFAELNNAMKNKLNPVPVIFAIDAVAFVTNPYLGIDSLSIFELGKIYRGEITNWKDVGGPDREITLYGRNSRSGTFAYIWQRIVQEEYSEKMTQLASNSEIVNAVKNDPNGIGYVGVGFIMDPLGSPSKDIWAVNVYIEGGKSYSPYQTEAIKSGDYPLTRPLYHYFNGIPSGELRFFLEYELSDEGQKLVRKCNYFPINENHKYTNQQHGISYPEEQGKLLGYYNY